MAEPFLSEIRIIPVNVRVECWGHITACSVRGQDARRAGHRRAAEPSSSRYRSRHALTE
jgi:hypothetical protein